MAALHLLFYLTLTLMLGTFFNSREPVIAIAIALIIAQMIQGLLPPVLVVILPYAMVYTATSVMVGEPAPSVAAIIAAPIWALLFTIIAVWRFRREEF
jgi:ABC-2 type transport system permease protein